MGLFPEIEPYDVATLRVSDLHTISYEQVGNPNGRPAVFLHGGPGVGISPGYRRFFDPDHYRVILP
ncbi:MAG: prolyl aminopeptidase, partial [Pseudomonadota bacterium]